MYYLVRIWVDAERTKSVNFEFKEQCDAIEFMGTAVETSNCGTEISITRMED